MLPSPSRRRLQRHLNLLRRLDLLLLELDLLPARDQPVSAGLAGKAQRLFAETGTLLGRPALSESSRQPGEILRAALLNSTRLNRRICEQMEMLRRKEGQSYPRTSGAA